MCDKQTQGIQDASVRGANKTESCGRTTDAAEPFRDGFREGYQRAKAEAKDWIEDMFTYHPPSREQLPKYAAIREAAKYFARVVVANTPCGADQSAAIRKLREAVMTANAAIALDGREP